MKRDANRIDILIQDLESRYGFTDPIVRELRVQSLKLHKLAQSEPLKQKVHFPQSISRKTRNHSH
jgi:hypothetical protein